MANQVIPRLNGDEYQHLYSWWHVLSLLRAREHVTRVRVEDRDAGSVDDVTVHHDPASGQADEFYHYFFQVKYHETIEDAYSSSKFLERRTVNGRSLLQKFYDSWSELNSEHPGRPIRLHLVTNWSWTDSADKLGGCISNQDGLLREEFFTSSSRSDIGKIREEWRSHVKADETSFDAFARCLHFYLGEGLFRQLQERVMERMELVGLKHAPNDLAVAVDIIRVWIRGKQGDITLPVLEEILRKRDLYLPPSAEPCVTVHLNTIAEGAFELDPDFKLDWRKYFEGLPDRKGHQLKNPDNWNKKLLPEMHAVLKDVRRTTTARLVRARGLARLSAWFALGHTFSEVAGFVLEVAQQDQTWRTDVVPSADFKMLISSGNDSDGELISGTGDTVACGISVSGSLDHDVRAHLATLASQPAAVLLLKPSRDLGRDCLRNAGDVVALARQSKELIRPFVKRWNARRVLFYYFGPLSGACFLGHQLNAVCREIQVMEDQQPGYAPSFLLT